MRHGGRRGAAAFTLVEVALAIAVVAFALVAIIGVLPTGMSAQRDNRQDTIINQDGAYWLEAVRQSASMLTNVEPYVESISVNSNQFRAQNASQIIGLLTTPKYPRYPDLTVTNVVTADVVAMAGSAILQPPNTNFSFKYRLQAEVTPLAHLPPDAVRQTTDPAALAALQTMATNAYEVRLTLRWPLLPGGVLGNGRRTFRALVSGGLTRVQTRQNSLYYFQPQAFQHP